jgi:hypothetical protein
LPLPKDLLTRIGVSYFTSEKPWFTDIIYTLTQRSNTNLLWLFNPIYFIIYCKKIYYKLFDF